MALSLSFSPGFSIFPWALLAALSARTWKAMSVRVKICPSARARCSPWEHRLLGPGVHQAPQMFRLACTPILQMSLKILPVTRQAAVASGVSATHREMSRPW